MARILLEIDQEERDESKGANVGVLACDTETAKR
jgi:hypothetical protein